jgi:flagellar L-ring protein precursor FlgH
MKGQIIKTVLLSAWLSFVWAGPWAYSLYTDRKGKQIGDVVTVLVIENAQASNDTRTETDENSTGAVSADAGTGFLDFLHGASLGMGSDVSYKGKGKTARKGELTATVSARIVEILDNGNLLVEGTKVVMVNDEQEILEVSGLLRPEDISPDNTVYSTKMADAMISYSGEGVASDAQEPGVITRFFQWLF